MKLLTDGEKDILSELNRDAQGSDNSEQWEDYLCDCEYTGETPSEAGFAKWNELP